MEQMRGGGKGARSGWREFIEIERPGCNFGFLVPGTDQLQIIGKSRTFVFGSEKLHTYTCVGNREEHRQR